MINKTDIKGDNNINISGLKRSKVSIGENGKTKFNGKFWVIAGVLVALTALIFQILIGWEQIIPWINAK